MTVGSRLITVFPSTLLKESSPQPTVLSVGICLPGCMLCSSEYKSHFLMWCTTKECEGVVSFPGFWVVSFPGFWEKPGNETTLLLITVLMVVT